MREKSLKFIVKSLMFPLSFNLFGCTKIAQRPPALVYPRSNQRSQSQPEYATYQSNYGYYQIEPNQAFASTPQPQGYQPVPQQNYVTQNSIPQQYVAPQQKIQTPALISTQKQNSTPVQAPVAHQTQPQYTPPTPPRENVILEEVVYIPSALQTTPVDEIEILSESKMPVEEFKKNEKISAKEKSETNEISNQYFDKPQTVVASVESVIPASTTTAQPILAEEKKLPQPQIEKENVKAEKVDANLEIKKPTQPAKPAVQNIVKPTITPQPQPQKITPVAEPRKPKKVKVYKGDTLYSIAQRNNIKVYDLAEHNNLKAPFTLKLGQTIEIPGDEPVKPVKAPEIITNLNTTKTFIEEPKKDFVMVKKGDTIYSIAKQNNVPLKDIILRNNLKAPYTLSIGEKIYIPNSAFHIVKAQDTAYSISRKYNVNLNSLVKLNKLTEPYTLTIGQKILLPAANVDVVQKQVKYVVKDKETTKTVMPSIKEEVKEVTQIRVAQKQKIEEKPKQIQTEVEVAKQEKIKSIIAKPEPLTSKRFMWPVNGKVISSYGIKSNGKRNDGINISAKIGTPVIAAENGIVAYAGNELKGLGNLVIIKHDKDYMTIYAHNETVLVRKGEMVKRGDKIATVGKTGRVTTPQLHFEIREKTKSVNPTDVLERK